MNVMKQGVKFLDEFKAFATRGNMIDMAVGIIVGGAFGKIISSLVSAVLMPPLGLLIGGVNFSDLKVTLKQASVDAAGAELPAVTINYGEFIQTLLDFVIIAFTIFLLVKMLSNLQKKKEAAPAPAPEPSADVQLLTEIRDLLKEKNKA